MPSDWVSPDSGAGTNWANTNLAYDDDLGTSAAKSINALSWSSYLELSLILALLCSKVRVYSTRSTTNITNIEVDVYYSGEWHNIYSGALTVGAYVEYAIGSEQSVTGMRVRYYNAHGTSNRTAYVWETDLWGAYPGLGRSLGFVIG